MVRMAKVVMISLAATLGVASIGAASDFPGRGPRTGRRARRPPGTESWVGKKAVTKYSAPLTDGDRIVNDSAGFRVYTVNRVDGDRVRLDARNISGWIGADDVVLLDEAIDFYTREIRANGRNVAAFYMRAWVRESRAMEEGDHRADGGDRHRTQGRPYASRGMMRHAEDESNLAIADLDKAIRLDAKLTFAYHERGTVRNEMGEYRKAVADLTEALHLDPKRIGAYNGRGIAWHISGSMTRPSPISAKRSDSTRATAGPIPYAATHNSTRRLAIRRNEGP